MNKDVLVAKPISEQPSFDISNEAWREYVYAGGSVLRVNGPLRLYVEKRSDGDRHRLVVRDVGANEIGMYVKPGWLAIRWQTPKGEHGITF